MIDRVEFKNYKSLVDFSMSLGRLTVLVGPNACGKSSVLAGLDLMSKVLRFKGSDVGSVARLLANARSVASAGSSVQLSVARHADGVEGELTLDFGQSPEWSHRVMARGSGRYSFLNSHCGVDQVRASVSEPLKTQDAPRGLSSILAVKLLKLDADVLAQPSYIYDVLPEVSTKGFGLPSALAQMATSDPSGWTSLQDSVSAVIPAVSRLRTVRERVDLDPASALTDGEEVSLSPKEMPTLRRLADVLLIDYQHAAGVPASKASSGTLLTIAVLAVLHSQERPKLVLIDDLDHGLHPAAMNELIAQIRRVLDAFPEVQVVATTHSPYLVDCLQPEEVRLLQMEDGRTVAASLTDHPDFERWKEAMMPGEFWSHVGEKWIFGATKRG